MRQWVLWITCIVAGCIVLGTAIALLVGYLTLEPGVDQARLAERSIEAIELIIKVSGERSSFAVVTLGALWAVFVVGDFRHHWQTTPTIVIMFACATLLLGSSVIARLCFIENLAQYLWSFGMNPDAEKVIPDITSQQFQYMFNAQSLTLNLGLVVSAIVCIVTNIIGSSQ